jgi:hypothetical protein
MRITRKIVPAIVIFGSIAALRADTPMLPGQSVPADYLVRMTQIHEQIDGDYRYVLALQAKARREKDIIKLNCVNDKLILVKAEQNIADSASAQLQVAQGADRATLFDDLSRAGDSVRNLRQQAGACVGELELTKQESGGQFTKPEFPDDPTTVPFDVYTEPPAYASPFN